MRGVLRKCCAALLMAALPVLPVSAALEMLSGSGEYIMEHNETMKEAQDIAFREAMRSISQQAGVYIESTSQAKDSQLTHDEVTALTETVVQVKEKRFDRDILPDGKIKVRATVTATLDTDEADRLLQRRVEAHKTQKQYEAARDEQAELQKKSESLQAEYDEAMLGGVNESTKRGDELMAQRKYAEAYTAYHHAVSVSPKTAELYSKRGESLRLQGKDDAAMQDYDKALSLDGQDALAHYGRASVLDKRGKRAEAVREYRLFVDIADIDFYDEEISRALDRILALEK